MLSHFKAALQLLYPVSCGGCGADGEVLCPSCTTSLHFVDAAETCPLCGRWTGCRAVCGACMDEDVPFREGIFGFYYEGRVRDAIQAFKFQGRKDVGRHLVSLLSYRLTTLDDRCSAIVPLPVTEKRLKERGFNQSFIIAEGLSALTGRPVLPSALRKSRETADQFTLSREERKKNVKKAFVAERSEELKGRTVLLVDDLFTTGATAREASRALRRAGAAAVILFCLARTP